MAELEILQQMEEDIALLKALDKIREIAFSIPAPNPYTPQLASLIMEAAIIVRNRQNGRS